MTLPRPFGWRTSWIAVETTKAERVIPELPLVGIRACSWQDGLSEASGKGVFVTPSVSGWTLIVGVVLPDATSEETLPLIVRMSETFGSTQYYGNHRVADYYAWAKAEHGRLIRAYAYLGERNTTLWDRGDLTPEEIELVIIFDGFDQNAGFLPQENVHPREHHVFAIAKEWSVDPTQIEEYNVSDSLGALGFSQ